VVNRDGAWTSEAATSLQELGEGPESLQTGDAMLAGLQWLVGWLGVMAAAMALWTLAGPATAADLGVIGPVHPIAEPDMVQEIKARIQAKKDSGELEAIDAEAKRRIFSRMENPVPVTGLIRTTAARSYYFDTSVRFDEAVVDHQGRVLIPAGTVANPLSVAPMPSTLLFFDARDPSQVVRAKAELDAAKGSIKPILVGGSPIALMKQWQRQVFFDQGGVLIRRFGILSVPARVRQEGQLLLVQEFPPQ